MNTTFKIGGCYELEITSDGSTHSKDPQSASCGGGRGTIGVMLHHENMFPVVESDGSPAIGPSSVWTTKAMINLKRSQARAIASALLSAVSEASE